MTYIQRDEITGARYSSSCHRRMSYLKNLVGQVVPQALPDAYKTAPLLDWMLADSRFDYEQMGSPSFYTLS